MAEIIAKEPATAITEARNSIKAQAAQAEAELAARHPELYTGHRVLLNGDIELWLGSEPLRTVIDSIPPQRKLR